MSVVSIRALALSLAIAIPLSPVAAPAASLGDVAAGRPEISKFVATLKATGLDVALAGKKPMTVFAPTDSALDALPGGLWARLQEPKNKPLLLAMLKSHLTPGNYPSTRLVAAKAPRFDIPTLAPGTITIDRRKALMAGPAALYRLDVTGDSGTLHIVDKVFLPPNARALLPAAPKTAAAGKAK
ncbi:MAG: fasciclin domain-containing protein [Hyphomicrobium sp.]